MATYNSLYWPKMACFSGKNPASARRDRPSRTSILNLLAALFLAGFVHPTPLQSASSHPSDSPKALAQYAQRIYQETKRDNARNPASANSATQFARACFNWADYSADDPAREALALEGIAAAEKAIRIQPKNARGHYFLALNSGQLARTRTLSALKIVQTMENSFLAAIKLDPSIDFGGPHRALGTLYRDAPGWPVSLGNRKNAEAQLRKALKLSPDYPGNHLSLLESLMEWEELDQVRQNLATTRKVLQKARHNLTGDSWASSWVEWDDKWKKIQAAVGSE